MAQQQIIVSIADQRLQLRKNGKVTIDVMIATAANGPGEVSGSECTPRGRHIVRAKIGGGCPIYTVFTGRRPTGEVYSEQLRRTNPDRDWILSRIMWLSGQEVGKNRLGNVDSMRRYIYIHGSPDDEIHGQPNSHGCVRMKNADVIRLYDAIDVGVSVLILEGPLP
ncbi:MAG: L,D-transpeptidase [Gammaproteobacteria bacterium]|nr:L,D-transpeptidase [Gammaproteobacteria bacterium]